MKASACAREVNRAPTLGQPRRVWNRLVGAAAVRARKPGRIPKRSWQARAVALQGLIVFVMAFGFHAYLAPYGIDPHHDGIMFKPALDVSQGKMVFRDTFTQYGGLTVLLQALALKIFGARLLILKLHTALMYGLSFLVFWRVWCRLMPTVLVTLVCAIGSVMGPDSIASSLPWSSVNALLFQGLTLLWAVRYMERGREVELLLAGCAGALTFWCRQPVGVFLSGGVFVAVILIAMHSMPEMEPPPSKYSLRSRLGQHWLARVGTTIVLFGGGLVITNGVILLWLAKYGALIDWWKQAILLPQVWSKATGDGYSLERILACLFPAGHLRVWGLMGAAIAIQAMRATSPFLDPQLAVKSPRASTALLVSTVAVTSWLQYYPISCNYHCYWAGIPMLGAFAYLFYSSHESRSRLARALVTTGVLGVVFQHDCMLRINAIKPHIAAQNVPVRSIPALRGMRVNPADAVNYDALQTIIAAYLRVHPKGTIITDTGHGLFPTLTSRQASFHPAFLEWEALDALYPDADAARANYVAKKLPIIIGPMPIPPTHVRAGHITWQGIGYNVLVPKDTRPTEAIICDGAGACWRSPIPRTTD